MDSTRAQIISPQSGRNVIHVDQGLSPQVINLVVVLLSQHLLCILVCQLNISRLQLIFSYFRCDIVHVSQSINRNKKIHTNCKVLMQVKSKSSVQSIQISSARNKLEIKDLKKMKIVLKSKLKNVRPQRPFYDDLHQFGKSFIKIGQGSRPRQGNKNLTLMKAVSRL